MLSAELKSDSKETSIEAIGLATYSNSKATVLSYASIFESLWNQTYLYEQTRHLYQQLKSTDKMKQELSNNRGHHVEGAGEARVQRRHAGQHGRVHVRGVAARGGGQRLVLDARRHVGALEAGIERRGRFERRLGVEHQRGQRRAAAVDGQLAAEVAGVDIALQRLDVEHLPPVLHVRVVHAAIEAVADDLVQVRKAPAAAAPDAGAFHRGGVEHHRRVEPRACTRHARSCPARSLSSLGSGSWRGMRRRSASVRWPAS